MAWKPIPNDNVWEYDDDPPDPGPIATRDLWLKQSNGIRVYKNHAVYVKCRRIGETVETRGEISKTFRDKLDPDWLAWNRYPYYSDYAINGIDPKLVLDFKGDRYRLPSGATSFDTALTYTGASTKTTFDGDGVLKWCPHNLLLQSQNLNVSPWTTTNTTVNSTPVLAPDGTNSAWRVSDDATNAIHRIFNSHGVPFENKCRTSVFAQYAGVRYLVIRHYGPSGNPTRWGIFDIQNGTVGNSVLTGGGSTSVITHSISEDLGNGWYLCTFETDVPVQGGSNGCNLFLSTTNPTTIATASATEIQYVGDGSGINLWGVNVSNGATLGGMVNNPDRGDSYVPTTSSARYLPRRGHHVYNGSAWVNEGLLLESEARTNLVTYSDDFTQWTNTNSTDSVSLTEYSPDGSLATELSEDTSSSVYHQISFSNSTLTGTTYTFSAYVKLASGSRLVGISAVNSTSGGNNITSVFDLSSGSHLANVQAPVGLTGTIDSVTIERVGGGWFRISQTPTAVSGTTYGCAIRLMDEATTNGLQYTGDGTSGIYIYGAQLEAGSTPSSYISTAGTTVTRAAEILDVAAADMPWPTPNVIGEELVTNGTFDSDVSGWAYTGTLGPDQDNYAESQSGELRLVGSATRTSRIQQSIATEIGKIYQFSFDLTSNLANQVVLEGISGTNVYNTVGSYQEVFIASATSITLVIRSSNITDVTLDNISVREIDPLSVSIQMDGTVTGNTYTPTRWYLDANNAILQDIGSTDFTFTQEAAGVVDTVTGGSFTSGVNTPYNIASRHGSTFINGAVDGTALTANLTPTALPDLSATNFQIGSTYMGTIGKLRVWAEDIGDTGIEEAST